MIKEFFGNIPGGKDIYMYTLKSENCEAKLMDYGANLVSFKVFGTDIVGGFDSIENYLSDDSHQGATIGRVANRIKDASFEMDGKKYTLTVNNGKNCLHGGVGFDFKVWNVKEYTDNSILFEYTSEDGEEGFPSRLDVSVRYTLFGTEMIIDYRAIPYGKTPIALTNHSYFNLNGFGGDILDHSLVIYADKYTKVDDTLIPTGERPEVAGTPFDFTSAHKIGERIAKIDGGYDHNYILCPTVYKEYLGKRLGLAAVLCGEKIKMSTYTDQPGIQLYTGNFLGYGSNFKSGVKQVRHGALCLETQTEPNCINSGIGFYDKGEIYTQTTVYSVEKI